MVKAFVQVQNTLARVLRRDGGATAVEYGMIVALIATAIAAAIFTVGGDIKTTFQNLEGDL